MAVMINASIAHHLLKLLLIPLSSLASHSLLRPTGSIAFISDAPFNAACRLHIV